MDIESQGVKNHSKETRVISYETKNSSEKLYKTAIEQPKVRESVLITSRKQKTQNMYKSVVGAAPIEEEPSSVRETLIPEVLVTNVLIE